MKHFLASIVMSLTIAIPSIAQKENPFEENIRKGMITMEMIKNMTEEDIPEKWKTAKTIVTKKDTKVVEFRRDKQLILTVTWYEKPRPNSKFQRRYVGATIHHNNEKIASVYRLKNAIHFKKEIEDSNYKITTIINDDGKKQLIVLGPDNYVEGVIFNEKETKPISDLEYAKSKLTQQFLIKPLMKDLEAELMHKLDEKYKKKKAKAQKESKDLEAKKKK